MKNATAAPPAQIDARAKMGKEIQAYGTLIRRQLSLKDSVRMASVNSLNQVLADTITLRDMYKKHHWQTAGPTFYPLHLLFDKHYTEQAELVDSVAERIQQLGGVSLAMAADVAEVTQIARPPRGSEDPAVQIQRLLDGHEAVLKFAHDSAKKADDAGDDGTNDLLISEIIRTNEAQVWFISEHLEPSELGD